MVLRRMRKILTRYRTAGASKLAFAFDLADLREDISGLGAGDGPGHGVCGLQLGR